MLLLIISFIAGCLTILAPCALPLLPVIIGGSVNSSKKEKARPYIIAAALAISIILFTLLLKVSTLLVNLSPNLLNDVSGGIVVALGLVAVFPEAWENIMVGLNLQAASQRFLGKGERVNNKYIGPILVGVALGPVFASCSPTYAFILASVLPHSFASGLVYLIVYCLGLVLTLLVVSLLGRKVIFKLNWAVDTHSLFRRIIGVIFIVIGVAIITGQEVKVETWVGNHLPFDETKVERFLLQKQDKSDLTKKLSQAITGSSVLNVQPTPAPAFAGLTNWINSKPRTIASLRGKVVLVDFWTYSCINCIRSIPYVEKWYQTYAHDGFVVVGVNTPEFAFEHNPANVAKAVIADHITYPVALDNNYDTWNAYDNDSWPADYLIDKNGDIRYVSLGEGNYNVTEKAIQQLLGINRPLTTPTSVVPISSNQSPETYFGTNREQNYEGSPQLSDGTQTFTAASNLAQDQWTLSGSWQINPEYITSESSSSTLTYNFYAKNVYTVAGSQNNVNQTGQATISPGNMSSLYGSDDPNGLLTIGGSRLYTIVSLKKAAQGTVRLQIPKGVSLYTFTFGS